MPFSVEEADFYTALHSRSKVQFDAYMAQGKALTNYASVLELLLRLRQACAHPFLVQAQGNANASASALGRHLKQGSASSARSARMLTKLSGQAQKGTATPFVQRCQPCEDGGATEDASVGDSADGTAGDEEEREECPVCLEPPDDAVITSCAHTFCRECILACLGHAKQVMCPLCRELISRDKLFTVPRASRFSFEPSAAGRWRSSAKLDALLSELHRVRDDDMRRADSRKAASERAATEGSGEGGDVGGSGSASEIHGATDEAPLPRVTKSVVFSQWTAMLDLVAIALERDGGSLPFCRLDGSMSPEERQRALKRFSDDSSIRVLLLSLKAGNVGLNLVVATRVFLLDPWWNPAVEEQALARVHRLGQQYPVVATRIIVRGTVEEKMLLLHERKRQLCSAATAAEAEAEAGTRNDELIRARRLRLEDLAMCFE